MDLYIIGYLIFFVFAIAPKMGLLIISIVKCLKRKYVKSSKIFLMLGMIVLLLYWIPASVFIFLLIEKYLLSVVFYILPFCSGVFLGFIPLMISFLISFKDLSKKMKGIWILCLSFLLSSFAFSYIASVVYSIYHSYNIEIDENNIIWFFFMKYFILIIPTIGWILEMTSYSILIKIVSFGQKIKGVYLNVNALETDKSLIPDEYKKIFTEAKMIKDQVLEKINSSTNIKKKVGSAIISQLNEFMGQIEKLVARKKYLDKVIKNETINEIDNQLKDLKIKHDEASDNDLKKEYEKSIRRTNDHKEVFNKMFSQKEIIILKIDSAITSLNQLNLAVANIHIDEVISNEDNNAIKEFQNTLKDLSDYVSNLQNNQ